MHTMRYGGVPMADARQKRKRARPQNSEGKPHILIQVDRETRVKLAELAKLDKSTGKRETLGAVVRRLSGLPEEAEPALA